MRTFIFDSSRSRPISKSVCFVTNVVISAVLESLAVVLAYSQIFVRISNICLCGTSLKIYCTLLPFSYVILSPCPTFVASRRFRPHLLYIYLRSEDNYLYVCCDITDRQHEH